MAFENANQDLILGDPNGARIELLANEAKIVLYNELDVAIMEFDGTAVFEGDTFSAIQIRNKEGHPKLQLDQFQAAMVSGFDQGQRIRMVPGEVDAQPPALEIEPKPIGGVRLDEGSITATSNAGTNGGELHISSPRVVGYSPMVVDILSQSDTKPIPSAEFHGDMKAFGFNHQFDGNLTALDDLIVGGHIDYPTNAYKLTEVNNNTTTLTADTELIVPIPTTGQYRLTGFLGYKTTGAGDFKFRFTFPGFGVTSELRWGHTGAAITGGPDPNMYFNNTVVPIEGSPSANFRSFWVSGALSAGDVGNFGIDWAQNTADVGPTFVLRRSWLKLEKVF